MSQFDDWITTREAEKITGYNLEYIRRLIRMGKIIAKKWNRDWMIKQSSLLNYQTEGDRRGAKPKPIDK